MRHSHVLATAADTDGAVRLWDVRSLHDPVASLPAVLPYGEQPPHLNAVPLYASLSARGSKGVVCIAEDPQGALFTMKCSLAP
jgi:WD40 repeat protein